MLNFAGESERTIALGDGITVYCSIEVSYPDKNGTIDCCIDGDGLPTRWNIKPPYHFRKHRDGSIAY